MKKLHEYIPNTIWIKLYPIYFAYAHFFSRMTIIKLQNNSNNNHNLKNNSNSNSNNNNSSELNQNNNYDDQISNPLNHSSKPLLLIHSPGGLDSETIQEIQSLGQVAYIVAPSNFHHLNITDAQSAFPEAQVYICPAIEEKQPELKYDAILSDSAPLAWSQELEQKLIRGSRYMWEVAFYHRSTQTLLLVDLVENFTDAVVDQTDWVIRFWMKWIFWMWNRPRPAPEYQWGWSDWNVAEQCLKSILEWDFERVIIAHGELIETNAHQICRNAWKL